MACAGDGDSCFSSPVDEVDQLLQRLLEITNSSVGNSLEMLIDSMISQSEDVAERALKLGNALVETSRRSTKKRDAKHNAESWTLPADLTAKVFSMLDTQSLCRAATTCHLLNEYANDPLCYANIDLTSTVPRGNDALVCKFVLRAGKNLRSLKLGILQSPHLEFLAALTHYEESSTLTWSCLDCLTMGDIHAGSFLRSLHLYNIDTMDNRDLFSALSACPSLLDLELVGMNIELRHTVQTISSSCHRLERLVLELKTGQTRGGDENLRSKTCHEFVDSCQNLNSLSLKGFNLPDHQVRILMEGSWKLRFVDFSSSSSLTGSFLRNLGSGVNLLEVLILRDCLHLEKSKIALFLSALLSGDFEFLKLLDVSNVDGLATDNNFYRRCYSTRNLPLTHLKKERPSLVVHIDFPLDESGNELGSDVDFMFSGYNDSSDELISSRDVDFMFSGYNYGSDEFDFI